MLASGPVTALFWKLLAIVFIVSGVVGVFLPIVPDRAVSDRSRRRGESRLALALTGS